MKDDLKPIDMLDLPADGSAGVSEFVGRDLSLLEFNRRVLHEALVQRIPGDDPHDPTSLGTHQVLMDRIRQRNEVSVASRKEV